MFKDPSINFFNRQRLDRTIFNCHEDQTRKWIRWLAASVQVRVVRYMRRMFVAVQVRQVVIVQRDFCLVALHHVVDPRWLDFRLQMAPVAACVSVYHLLRFCKKSTTESTRKQFSFLLFSYFLTRRAFVVNIARVCTRAKLGTLVRDIVIVERNFVLGRLGDFQTLEQVLLVQPG